MRSHDCGREERPRRGVVDANSRRAANEVTANRFQKVVLARSLEIAADAPFAESRIADRLRTANPSATTFVAAKGRSRFLGATPELLVRLRGRAVETVALWPARSLAAPTTPPIARTGSPIARQRERSRSSMRSSSRRFSKPWLPCAPRSLEPPARRASPVPAPSSISPRRSPARSPPGAAALDLVDRLHPTPAVGGFPRERRAGRSSASAKRSTAAGTPARSAGSTPTARASSSSPSARRWCDGAMRHAVRRLRHRRRLGPRRRVRANRAEAAADARRAGHWR